MTYAAPDTRRYRLYSIDNNAHPRYEPPTVKAFDGIPSAGEFFMDIKAFEDYIARFNAADRSAFVENLTENVVMQNGGMFLRGRQAVLDHYETAIWPFFKETVTPLNVVADAGRMAVLMWTHFEAAADCETPFGSVHKGDTFDYRGVVFYEMDADSKFDRIYVSYLTFVSTPVGADARNLPIPH